MPGLSKPYFSPLVSPSRDRLSNPRGRPPPPSGGRVTMEIPIRGPEDGPDPFWGQILSDEARETPRDPVMLLHVGGRLNTVVSANWAYISTKCRVHFYTSVGRGHLITAVFDTTFGRSCSLSVKASYDLKSYFNGFKPAL